MTRIGYARVSTEDQKLDLQIDALRASGCEAIYREKKSGASRARPRLEAALARLHPGDTLVVWKLDRLGRSFPHLVRILEELEQRQIVFVSLSDAIDTGTATGKLNCRIFSAIADFERSMIVERTRAGMAAAKKRGKPLGRRRSISDETLERATVLLLQDVSLQAVAAKLSVNRTTLWRALGAHQAAQRRRSASLDEGGSLKLDHTRA